jgi:hypothetical protein
MQGLDTILPRLGAYVAHAREVAAALGRLPGARIHPDPPHTHQFQLWLPYPAAVLNDAALALAEREGVWLAFGWHDRPPTGLAMVEMTVAEPALSLTPAEIAKVADDYLHIIG